MGDVWSVNELKDRLRQAVAEFCTRAGSWKLPISETVSEIKANEFDAVFFGGTLRSILLSRIGYTKGKKGRPRDVDIVVGNVSSDHLHEVFRPHVSRRTRFGGLHLNRGDYPLDIWPLENTWAFSRIPNSAKFEDLPRTTSFNLEAIAIDIWPKHGSKRIIYSGDDQFFKGVRDRVVELNLEENPFPDLLVLRGLLLAANLDFSIGPKFSNYIKKVRHNIAWDDLIEVQIRHYGLPRASVEQIFEWVDYVCSHGNVGNGLPIKLPKITQGMLWEQDSQPWSATLHVHHLP